LACSTNYKLSGRNQSKCAKRLWGWNSYEKVGNSDVAGNKKKTSARIITVLTATDLHQSKELYRQLKCAVAEHRPDVIALVGDCLHTGDDMKGKISVVDCASILSSLACQQVVFVRGNHEDENWDVFAKSWRRSNRPLVTLHGQTFTCGPLVIVGFPCLLGLEDYFIAPREPLSYEPDEWLKPLLRLHGASFRTLWLMHEPPNGTPLSAANTVVSGNQEWTDAIEYFNPRLVVCGHDHWTPIRTKRWHCRIGASTCVNVGQTDEGPLHFAVVKARFENDGASQPLEIKISAFPIAETIAA
jgi:Icc-related predicted phosphoesterase